MSADPCEFQSFGKIPRLSRETVVTEKIDGTNAQILIVPAADARWRDTEATVLGDALDPNAVTIFAGSRSRWIQPGNDNYGFAAWVRDNAAELAKLGPGRHFGEWWGGKIQRGYGIKERRFSLFNVSRWFPQDIANGSAHKLPDMTLAGVLRREEGSGLLTPGPTCCHVVPTIWRGILDTREAEDFLAMLIREGSFAQPGFDRPEGIVLFHAASGQLFKKTCQNDTEAKSAVRDNLSQSVAEVSDPAVAGLSNGGR